MAGPEGLQKVLTEFTEAALQENPANYDEFGRQFFASRTHTASPERPAKRLRRMDSFHSESEDEVFELPKDYFPPAFRQNMKKRKSVFAPAPRIEELVQVTPVVYAKDSAEEIDMLRRRLKEFFLFKSVEPAELDTLVHAMFKQQTSPGDVIISQGAVGDYFYLVEKGLFDVFVSGIHVAEYRGSGYFGELALLHDCPRAATVLSVGHGVLWRLDRQSFCATVMKSSMLRRMRYEELLAQKPFFQGLNEVERATLADALEPCSFSDGDRIIYQGNDPDYFYILVSGSVRVTRHVKLGPAAQEMEVCTLEPGAYFGELALLTEKPRAASIWAVGDTTCARLSRRKFERIMGSYADIMKRNAGRYERQLQDLLGPSPDGYLGLELSTL